MKCMLKAGRQTLKGQERRKKERKKDRKKERNKERKTKESFCLKSISNCRINSNCKTTANGSEK